MSRLLVAGTLTAALVLSSCSGAVSVGAPSLDAEQGAACEQLLGALPDRLDDLDPVDVEPVDAPAAAYGDPAITLTCGVGRPEGYDRFAECLQVNDVGWFVPQEAGTEPVEVTLTAAGYRPRLQVVVPAEYWPSGVATVTAELAEAVSSSLELVQPCR